MSKVKDGKKSRLTVILLSIFNPVIAILVAAAIICVPILSAYGDTLGKESVYHNVFVSALGDKYNRLCSVKEPKIAVVGGSSVAFGIDSELLSRHTGMEVVNFGLYATLGSKIMLDLSKNAMREGDIVIFAPEPDRVTMSTYFGADSAWQAIDASPELLRPVLKDNRRELIDAFADYRENKAEYLRDGAPDPMGIYNRRSFDEYGDICYPRPYNIMAMGYDPNTLFDFDTGIISDELLCYFNEYANELTERGVRVYFSFSPINRLALAEGVGAERLEEYESYIEERLVCPVISDIEDYVMDWGYFFDTNMHLNDAGVIARTNMLIQDIRRALGMSTVMLSTPAAPGKESGNEFIDGNTEYADYFLYEEVLLPDGTLTGVRIVGVTDKARSNTDTEITLPYYYGEIPVIALGADILSEIPCVKTVHIGENVTNISDGAFRGCKALREVHLGFTPDSCSVSIPDTDNRGLMEGARDGVALIPREEYLEDFRTHYTWGHYDDYYLASSLAI